MMAVTTLLLEKEDCTTSKILTIVLSYEDCIVNQLSFQFLLEVNARNPDFKHKKTKEGLWLEDK
jgi:hypothetical protein